MKIFYLQLNIESIWHTTCEYPSLREVKWERILAMGVKYHGLCESCESDGTCTLRRSTRLKIVQCEDYSFRSFENQNLMETGDPFLRDSARAAQFGICSNCLYVHSCGFPDARLGVFHCEEYTLDEEGLMPSDQSGHSRPAA